MVTIERSGSVWKVFTQSKNAAKDEMDVITCEKLIMATGICSKPNIPEYDISTFDGFRFHAKDMASRYKELTAENVDHVTIVGGHKSALEAVGTASQAGKEVEWLIREEGLGPTWSTRISYNSCDSRHLPSE